jgi:hypothetical protein
MEVSEIYRNSLLSKTLTRSLLAQQHRLLLVIQRIAVLALQPPDYDS